MQNKFLIECRDVEPCSIIVNYRVRLVDQVMGVLHHIFWFALVDGVKYNALFLIPFCGPAHRVPRLNNFIYRNVLTPQTPGVNLMRGRLDVN